jgi:hypothetical protein
MKYANDTSVLIVDCDCHDDRTACELTTPVYRLPTFFLIYRAKLMQIRIERTFKDFVDLIEKVKSLDRSIPCPYHFNQSDEYPYIIVSGPEEPSVVCERIHELSAQIPESKDRILLGDRTDRASVVVQHEKEEFLRYTGDGSFESVLAFGQDYIHKSFGGWPLSESRLLTHRRFGYLLMLHDWHLQSGERFIMSQWEKWCFWLMNASIFRDVYPQIEINDSELPSLAVFNKERSRFRVLRSPAFGPELKEVFDNISAVDDDPEMVFPFFDPWEPYEPEDATPAMAASEEVKNERPL